jgi:hypothetical protein
MAINGLGFPDLSSYTESMGSHGEAVMNQIEMMQKGFIELQARSAIETAITRTFSSMERHQATFEQSFYSTIERDAFNASRKIQTTDPLYQGEGVTDPDDPDPAPAPAPDDGSEPNMGDGESGIGTLSAMNTLNQIIEEES